MSIPRDRVNMDESLHPCSLTKPFQFTKNILIQQNL